MQAQADQRMNGDVGPTPARTNGDDERPRTVTTSAHLSTHGTLVSKQTWAPDDEQMQAQADQRMNGDVAPSTCMVSTNNPLPSL
jgi:hypothetical protein